MMPALLDPEGRELAAILEFAPELPGSRVLEVGCGDGRLTFRYAERASRVLAIDPDAQRITKARTEVAGHTRFSIEFREGVLETLPRDSGPFDVVILAWSL